MREETCEKVGAEVPPAVSAFVCWKKMFKSFLGVTNSQLACECGVTETSHVAGVRGRVSREKRTLQ